MTEKKYEDAIELILTPSFLTNYPQIIFTYKTKTLNQKTLKKRQYPLKNESIKYFKQKKTNPFIQVPLNENSQKTPKKSLVKVANMDFLKNNKEFSVKKPYFFEDEVYKKKLKKNKKIDTHYQKSIFFVSGIEQKNLWKFRVFKDSELGIKNYHQKKIIEREKDMDCQTEKSDLSNAIKYITNSVRISIKNERKKKKKP